MIFVVDTNVIAVANDREAEHAPGCVLQCVRRLLEIRESARVALDERGAIFKEYLGHGSLSGEPGAGDGFVRWLFNNQWNTEHCDQVDVTPMEDGSYLEFPTDERLAKFDLNDRKFVAVAIVHPERPAILNAVDSDWDHFVGLLAEHGVKVECLCPSAP